MNAEAGDEVVIRFSKLDAARRNLEAAVRMYSIGSDPIPIHVLAFAAHEVLSDLAKRRRQYRTIFEQMLDIVRPEHRKEVKTLFRKARNFMNHADQDSDGLCEFRPALNEWYLFDACWTYLRMAQDSNPTFQAYAMWFQARNPSLLTPHPLNAEFLRIAKQGGLATMPFREVLHIALQGWARFHGQKV